MGKTTHPEQPVKLSPEDLYSKLYRIAGHILRETNPCQIQRAADGSVSCVDTREAVAKGYKANPGLCCGGCQHLTPTGCNAEALSCKVWHCSAFRRARPEVAKALDSISAVAYAAHIPLYIRASKETTFRRVL